MIHQQRNTLGGDKSCNTSAVAACLLLSIFARLVYINLHANEMTTIEVCGDHTTFSITSRAEFGHSRCKKIYNGLIHSQILCQCDERQLLLVTLLFFLAHDIQDVPFFSHRLLFCGMILLNMCVVIWVVTQVEADLDPAESLYPTWQSCSPSGTFHNNNKRKKREKEEACECVASRSPPAHLIFFFLIQMSSLHLQLSDNKCDAF